MTPARTQTADILHVAADVLREGGRDVDAELVLRIGEVRECLESIVELANDGALGIEYCWDANIKDNDNACSDTCDCTICLARSLVGKRGPLP